MLFLPVLALLSGLILSCPRSLEAQTWTGSFQRPLKQRGQLDAEWRADSSGASVIITNATNNPVHHQRYQPHD